MNSYISKILLLFILSLALNIQAQNEEDGLRYAMDDVTGTARFTGMSGAFSSLGGDMSAVGLNPAGLTTFSTNRLSAAYSFFGLKNSTDYFNNSAHRNYNSFDDKFFDFDNLGGALVYKSDTDDWNKIALGFNYNKSADYGNNYRMRGLNTNGNSVTDYFISQAQGVSLGDIKVGSNETIADVYDWLGTNIGYNAQQAFLGYQSYILNPVDPNDDNNIDYTSSASFTNVQHDNKINSSGDKSFMDFSFAGTYKKHLQLGASLTFYTIDYKEHNSIFETGYNPTSDLKSLKLANTLRVEGSGVQLKMGAIYKFDNNLRLSLAYHTPQWLKIEEFMKQSVHTEFNNGDVVDVAPDIENSFAPYRVISPSKVIAGASYVVGKKGIISADYTYQDFSNLHFKEIDSDADTDYFDGVNDYISNHFQAVHKVNIGGELRLSELSLRAGTFMSTSPYKQNDKLYAPKGYSAGLSYDFDGVVVDFAWMHSDMQMQKTVLTLPDTATLNQIKNKFVLGVRYDF